MKKKDKVQLIIIWLAVLVSGLAVCIGYSLWTKPVVHSQEIFKDPTPPDPNRPYYDQYGNKYDYQGNLIDLAPETVDNTSFTGK